MGNPAEAGSGKGVQGGMGRMKTPIFQIELSAEGPSGGWHSATLGMPAEDYEICDALQKVRSASRGQGMEASILECRAFPALTGLCLDAPTLDELNFFALRLMGLSGAEWAAFQALAGEMLKDGEEGGAVGMKDLINSTYGLGRVPVLFGISSLEGLGRFVVEHGLEDAFSGLSGEILPYLDLARIGREQQERDRGVFVGRDYVAAGQYERPEVYDGREPPELEAHDWFLFRLLVGETPETDSNETAGSAEWISLPMDKTEADQVARLHYESRIEDCACFGFQSRIPQISGEQFTDMMEFDWLNRLASWLAHIPPMEQVKFKAVLSAEQPVDMDGVMDIAGNLSQYEFSAVSGNPDEFFKEYLRHLLDSGMDSGWLDTLPTWEEGEELLGRLGASITDYGVVSARGRSLYEPVPREPSLEGQGRQPYPEGADPGEIDVEDEGYQMGGI